MEGDEEMKLEQAEIRALKGALKPFVEAWRKRAGPNQPSISSEMLVAVHVKHYINAEKVLEEMKR